MYSAGKRIWNVMVNEKLALGIRKDTVISAFPDELKALPKFYGAEDAMIYDITDLKGENGWKILFSNYD